MGDLARLPLLEKAPTTHAGLLAWVEEVAELTQPDRIYWVDGSDAENTRLTDELVAVCEQLVAITQYGSTRSLNAGAAAAIAMYHWALRWAAH